MLYVQPESNEYVHISNTFKVIFQQFKKWKY